MGMTMNSVCSETQKLKNFSKTKQLFKVMTLTILKIGDIKDRGK